MLCEENLLSIKEKGKKWDRHGDHFWTNINVINVYILQLNLFVPFV